MTDGSLLMSSLGTPLPRDAFDLGETLWVMHCAEGPVPRAAAEAVSELFRKETAPWKLRWEEDFLGLPRRTREEGARLLGSRTEDLSLVATTSAGLAAVAQGLDWRAGDEVLVPLGEFPSNAWPWRTLESRGVRFREAPLWEGHRAGDGAWESLPVPPGVDPEARLLNALDPRTRLLSVSWVRFQDGLRLDVQRLAAGCAERGVVFVIDGIQGAGTLPVTLESLPGLVAFAAGGHKGLLAPQGLGLLWTAAALRSRLAPPGGWLSVEGATDFSRPSTDFDRGWLKDGEKLELGVPNLLGCAALGESLALLNGAGTEAVATHVAFLQMRFLAGLGGIPAWQEESRRLAALLDAGRLGSILALHHGCRGSKQLMAILEAGFSRGIFASVREGYLRIALPGWHTPDDVDRVLSWLRRSF
jgi:selenocysteine lyase/cysteine desulfurase